MKYFLIAIAAAILPEMLFIAWVTYDILKSRKKKGAAPK